MEWAFLHQNERFGIEKSSLPICVNILRFKMEAQIEPQTIHADDQRGLPQCAVTSFVANIASYILARTLESQVNSGSCQLAMTCQLHRHADSKLTGSACTSGNGNVPASCNSVVLVFCPLGKATWKGCIVADKRTKVVCV